MASKFKRGDKVRLKRYVAGYGPSQVWKVFDTFPSFHDENTVKVVASVGVRTFREDDLELVNKRVEGQEIRPEDVKMGDTVKSTYTTMDGITMTRQGVVERMRELTGGGFVMYTGKESVYHDNWIYFEGRISLELVKAAPEPHPLAKAKIGDYFEVQRDIKYLTSGSNRYTKVREDVWFVEQIMCDGKVNQFCRTNDSVTKAIFDQRKCKLVVI